MSFWAQLCDTIALYGVPDMGDEEATEGQKARRLQGQQKDVRVVCGWHSFGAPNTRRTTERKSQSLCLSSTSGGVFARQDIDAVLILISVVAMCDW